MSRTKLKICQSIIIKLDKLEAKIRVEIYKGISFYNQLDLDKVTVRDIYNDDVRVCEFIADVKEGLDILKDKSECKKSK